MALPDRNIIEPRTNPVRSGLLLIDDLPFLRQIAALAAELGIELRTWNDSIESIDRHRLDHCPDFVVIDRLLTRIQLYTATRTIRQAIGAPVIAISADMARSPVHADRGVMLLSREEAIIAIRRLMSPLFLDSTTV